MSHAGDPSHPQEHIAPGAPPHTAPAPAPFAPAELQSLHKADILAAGWIVGLMGGIFSVGVVLYLIVFWSVFDAAQWWAPTH